MSRVHDNRSDAVNATVLSTFLNVALVPAGGAVRLEWDTVGNDHYRMFPQADGVGAIRALLGLPDDDDLRAVSVEVPAAYATVIAELVVDLWDLGLPEDLRTAARLVELLS